MNAQYTPGSWTLDPCASGWMLISNSQDITAEPFDARDADARLIAAAPDLLNALQIAENALDIYSGGESLDLAAIRIAIAKATGSST